MYLSPLSVVYVFVSNFADLLAFINSSKFTSSFESLVLSNTTTRTSSSSFTVESTNIGLFSFTSIWDKISCDLSEEFLSNSP